MGFENPNNAEEKESGSRVIRLPDDQGQVEYLKERRLHNRETIEELEAKQKEEPSIDTKQKLFVAYAKDRIYQAVLQEGEFDLDKNLSHYGDKPSEEELRVSTATETAYNRVQVDIIEALRRTEK